MGFLNGGNQYLHEDARQVICSCCGIKTTKKKKINENEEALVRKFCKPSYDSELREQPAGLCNTCDPMLLRIRPKAHKLPAGN